MTAHFDRAATPTKNLKLEKYGRFGGRAVCEATGLDVPDPRCPHQPRKQGVT
jgi:hypothetical protein